MRTEKSIRKMYSTFMLRVKSGAYELEFEAYIDRKGIYRWVSNQRVVPDEVLYFNRVDLGIRARCQECRDTETLREYRKTTTPQKTK